MAGVYLSYPFCGQKCTYCNFASGVLPSGLEAAYAGVLLAEIESHNWRWTPETVYWGGGTPSRMAPSVFARLMAAIPGRPWKEATIEAAPGDITQEKARLWRDAGVTRASLGAQSFVEAELRQTGRRHRADTIARDVETLRAAGIASINIDLIAGLPLQTPESWEQSLGWIQRLEPPHVSVYMLEIDEDSRLGLEILNHGSRYGASHRPSEDLTAELYERAVDRLSGFGLPRYEISNFARPGFESAHNLKYWRLEPYAGFGAGAHSFDQGLRWQNPEQAGDYVSAGPGGAAAEAHSGERFFVGLRLMEGVRPSAIEWTQWNNAIVRLERDGLLERAGKNLRLTRRGVLLSNEVFQEFLVP